MSANRLQKLLLSEYSDFQDMVLVESPFAQTTREGKGIRQVHLGITPSKLILATDKLNPAKDTSTSYIPGVDPELETFELVAVYPVECVTLSVFHRRKRKAFKAHFCNQRVLYFELGGFQNRNMFWNLWCERIKSISAEDPASSHSETSVATSTSNSTMYLVSRRKVVTDKGVQQLWCKFGAGDCNPYPKWLDKNTFLGKNFEETTMYYIPEMRAPSVSQFVMPRKRLVPRNKLSLSSAVAASNSNDFSGETFPVNRFAEGIREGCSTSLFLPAENYIVPNRFSQTNSQSTGIFSKMSDSSYSTFCDMAEASVRLWENYKETEPNLYRIRHKRRYGISPQPHFLFGLGPWNITPGARYSTQVKRASSAVTIRRQPNEPELRLPVSRRQLTASISSEALHLDKRLCFSANNIKLPPKGPVIFFWTPEYWYRPRSARDAYQELRNHLSRIHDFQNTVTKSKEQKNTKKKLFRKKKKAERESTIALTDSDECLNAPNQRRSTKATVRFFGFFGSKAEDANEKETKKETQETSLQYLRRILRMDIALTAWDFDSTTLAHQLTLIDKELFLKIPPVELGVLIWQQSSKNAPNIGALVAFSHRISCLVASEVLRDDSEKIRARLVARFINAAEKCNRMSNFQSCKSLLCGLQSPSVYRLHSTWSYVRKRHASRYQAFENLCRLYRDPRLPSYQRAFTRATQSIPYMPFIGDLIARLLDKLPNFGDSLLFNPVPLNVPQLKETEKPTTETTPTTVAPIKDNSNILRKFLSTLKVWPISDTGTSQTARDAKKTKKSMERVNKGPKDLIDFYGPLNIHHDNRMQRLREAVELLEKFQRAAAQYNITVNDLAREYLLKARYREDRDNFLCSFNREVPKFVHNDQCKNDE